MNCQFSGCQSVAEYEILYGKAQSLSTPVCSKHMADEYCSDPKKYSNCRFMIVGGDRTFKPNPHVAQDVEAVQNTPIFAPPEEAGCGGCKGCK